MTPNPALQRTSHAGDADYVGHATRPHEPSLSFDPLGTPAMFSKREKKSVSVATALGEFVWDGHYAWKCEFTLGVHRLFFSLVGARFELTALAQFERALEQLEQLCRTALEASLADLAAYRHCPEQMSLVGLSVEPARASEEDVQLVFSFQDWPDGGLTVHFKDLHVVGTHIDD